MGYWWNAVGIGDRIRNKIRENIQMTEKNKEKAERKARRKMWTGFYPRRTKTKREAEESQRKKHKGRADE